MNIYTVGFAFDHYSMENVLLVEKKKPDFMAGKFNGIGGSVKLDETPAFAHLREWQEEVSTEFLAWTHFATLHRPCALVYVYVVIAPRLRGNHAPRNDQGEKLLWIDDWRHKPDLPYFESVQMLMHLARIAECDPLYSTIQLSDVPRVG